MSDDVRRNARAYRAFARQRQIAGFLSAIGRAAQSLMPPDACAAFVAQCDAVARSVFGVAFVQFAPESAATAAAWTADDDAAFGWEYAHYQRLYALAVTGMFLKAREVQLDATERVVAQMDGVTVPDCAVWEDAGCIVNYWRWIAASHAIALPEFAPLSEDETRHMLESAGWTFCEAHAGDPVYDASGHRCGELSEAEAQDIRRRVRSAPGDAGMT